MIWGPTRKLSQSLKFISVISALKLEIQNSLDFLDAYIFQLDYQSLELLHNERNKFKAINFFKLLSFFSCRNLYLWYSYCLDSRLIKYVLMCLHMFIHDVHVPPPDTSQHLLNNYTNILQYFESVKGLLVNCSKFHTFFIFMISVLK